MKKLTVILLLAVVFNSQAQQIKTDDATVVTGIMKSYQKAVERLDTAATGTLFLKNSQIVESGSVEGNYSHYLIHHLGPELNDFKSFTFSDYKISVVVDLPYAFATETYQYTVVVKKDNSVANRKGVATTILRKENGVWKIWQTHTSARKP